LADVSTSTGAAPQRTGILHRKFAGSVRARLTVTVVLVVGASMFVGGTMLTAWVRATIRNDIEARNERVLATMSNALINGNIPAELYSNPALLSTRLDRQLDSQVMGDGMDVQEVLSTTYFYLEGPAFSRLKIQEIDSQGRLILFGREGPALPDPEDSVEMTAFVPTQWGSLTLHAVSPLSAVDDSIGALAGALWLGLPMVTVLAGILTWFITGRTLAPVGQITDRVRQMTATTMDARVPVPDTDDEIHRLAVTMNEMLERLERSSEAQRRFISDASHELRSPVASIRAQLETALGYPDAVDWPDVAKVVLAEDERLEHLVANLLAVARLEEDRDSPRAEVDLDEIVMAQRKRVTSVPVDTSAVSAGRVMGNSDEITSVVRNLIDNAMRHTTSKVVVSLRAHGPFVVLSVSDDGPGVPVDLRDRVFERFARLDEGRQRDAGGTGLGLALTKRIVEQHGGTIYVTDADIGGACFVVSLPALVDELDDY
jgi:signal transduction histidine kinase